MLCWRANLRLSAGVGPCPASAAGKHTMTFRLRTVLLVALLPHVSLAFAEPQGTMPTSELSRQCPASHLERLSPADLRDALDAYKMTLDKPTQATMDAAEAKHCAGVSAGATCANAGDLEISAQTGHLSDISARLCAQFTQCTAPSQCAERSGQELLDTVRRGGASRVAQSMSETEWSVAFNQAESGKADWLEAVAALRPVTDAGRTESIDSAISHALLPNPTGVLRLLANHPDLPGTAWYCADRDIEPLSAAAAQWVALTRSAVSRVDDPALRSRRDECLVSLGSTND